MRLVRILLRVWGLAALGPTPAQGHVPQGHASQGYTQAAPSFEQFLDQLIDRSFKVKSAAVDAIAAGGDERAPQVLTALLNGRLFYRKSDRLVVHAEWRTDGYRITAALSGEPLGGVGRYDVKKIGINNKLRRQLRAAIAGLALGHAEPEVRLDAVRKMMSDPDPNLMPRLRARLDREQDAAVREALEQALAVADLASPNVEVRLAAVAALRGNLEPVVRNRLPCYPAGTG